MNRYRHPLARSVSPITRATRTAAGSRDRRAFSVAPRCANGYIATKYEPATTSRSKVAYREAPVPFSPSETRPPLMAATKSAQVRTSATPTARPLETYTRKRMPLPANLRVTLFPGDPGAALSFWRPSRSRADLVRVTKRKHDAIGSEFDRFGVVDF